MASDFKQISNTINTPFRLNNDKPLDVRFVIPNINEIDSPGNTTLPFYVRYAGLIVYSIAQNALFVFYKDSNELKYTQISTALDSNEKVKKVIEETTLLTIKSALNNIESQIQIGEFVFIKEYNVTLQKVGSNKFQAIQNHLKFTVKNEIEFEQIPNDWKVIGNIVQVASEQTKVLQINGKFKLEDYKYSSNSVDNESLIDGKIYIIKGITNIAFAGKLYKLGTSEYREQIYVRKGQLTNNGWITISHNFGTEDVEIFVKTIEGTKQQVACNWKIVNPNSIEVQCNATDVKFLIIVRTR